MNDGSSVFTLEELMMAVLTAGRKRAEAEISLQFLMSSLVLRRNCVTRADIDDAHRLKQAADSAYVDALWAYYAQLDRMVWSGESP